MVKILKNGEWVEIGSKNASMPVEPTRSEGTVKPPGERVKETATESYGGLIKKRDLQVGMSPQSLIEYAMERRMLITWSAMYEVMWGGAFMNVRINQMISKASITCRGADALLVDNNGMYSASAPVQRHYEWLKNHGYSIRPQVKG